MPSLGVMDPEAENVAMVCLPTSFLNILIKAIGKGYHEFHRPSLLKLPVRCVFWRSTKQDIDVY